MAHRDNFWDVLWQELAPVIRHAVVVLTLEVTLVLIGAIAWILERLFPKHAEYLSWLETVDIWTALVLLCMFAVYTIIKVGAYLYQELKKT